MLDPELGTLLLSAANTLAGAVATSAARSGFKVVKGGRDLKHSIAQASEAAARAVLEAFPSAAYDGFDQGLINAEGVSDLLAQCLTLTQQPSPSELANLWQGAVGIGESNLINARHWAEVFLSEFETSLRQDSHLQEQQMSRTVALRSRGADHDQPVLLCYLEWLERRTRQIDTRGMSEEPTEVNLDSCYEALRAIEDRSFTWADRPVTKNEIEVLKAELARKGLSALEVEEKLADDRITLYHDVNAKPTPNIDVVAQVDSTNAIVILGDPGGGKSTILRYLAHQHVMACLRGYSRLANNLGKTRFPILIRVADFVERDGWQQTPLLSHLREHPAAGGCTRGEEVNSLIQRELEAGECLVLVDGLDEVPQAADRERMTAKIQDLYREFINDTTGNHLVVTSRVAGYRAAPLTTRFTHLRLVELDLHQISHFTSRWAEALERTLAPDVLPEERIRRARELAESVGESVRSKPAVRQLAGTPLLLTMMILRARAGKSLPTRRSRLYGDIALALAGSWRSFQLPSGTILPDERDTMALLANIGYWIHEKAPTGLVTEAQLTDLLDEAGFPRSTITVLREHVGIIAQRSPERYGFVHRTFQEFFAGLRLLDQSDRERDASLKDRLSDPSWQEPILLGLGWLSETTPARVREVMSSVIWPEWSVKPGDLYEQLLGFKLHFFLRCLADDLPAQPEQVKKALILAQRSLISTGQPYLDWALPIVDDLLFAIGQTATGRFFDEELRDEGSEISRREDRLYLLVMSGRASDEELSEAVAGITMWDRDRARGIIRSLARLSARRRVAEDECGRLLSDPAIQAEYKELLLRFLGRVDYSSSLTEIVRELAFDPANDLDVRQASLQLFVLARPTSGEVRELLEAFLTGPDGLALLPGVLFAMGQLGWDASSLVDRLSAVAKESGVSIPIRSMASRTLASYRRLGVPGADEESVALLGESPGDALAMLALNGDFSDVGGEFDDAIQRLQDGLASEALRILIAQGLSESASAISDRVNGIFAEIVADGAEPEAVRVACAQALGDLGSASDHIIARLADLVRNQSETVSVREGCADALGRLGVTRRALVQDLLELLELPSVTSYLKRSLLQLAVSASLSDERAAVGALAVLKDRSIPDFVRYQASRSLHQIGYLLPVESLDDAIDSLWIEASEESGFSARRAIVELLECQRLFGGNPRGDEEGQSVG